ncbi:MAG: hypothetical protein KGH61_04730 [Candidatus Micrarchaeota archaeon]|nr:hypothetical protein [Candidatus Micrarchaeota archaeon]MDE1848222.1 hypothetical protein [Candidatus Micrarchaeota archaeon]MDE1864892.1 hypothetical protein [Candidatus Micrarchaeota archaeon]
MRNILLSMLSIPLVITAFSMTLLASGQQCGLSIGSNTTYTLSYSISCANSYALTFPAGTRHARVDCAGFELLGENAILFGNSTFNNTVSNCTIDGVVYSSHNATNNLIASIGAHLGFMDNSSLLRRGNYYHLAIYTNNVTNTSVADFVQIFPYDLVLKAPYLISMGTSLGQVEAGSASSGIALPLFGVYPQENISGSRYFMVENQSVSQHTTTQFGPYYLYSPYVNHDNTAGSIFNATYGAYYYPTFIYPHPYPYAIMPANKPVYWNFTIYFHMNASSSTFRLLNGFQNDPNETVVATLYNLGNGTLRYDLGMQSPGLHYFIGLLDTPYEHMNTTSITYSVGISYCSSVGLGIQQPGYYPLAYGSVRPLHIFWLTNGTCAIGVPIDANNVTVDCRNGTINSTVVGVRIGGSNNVTIENCNLHGSGVNVSGSQQVRLINDRFYASNATSYGIYESDSQVYFNSSSFYNFSENQAVIHGPSPPGLQTASTTTVAKASSSTATTIQQPPAKAAPQGAGHLLQNLIIFLAIMGAVFAAVARSASKSKTRS